jgi:hypothetical protein
MAIFDPQFKWGTEIEYNLIKVCNEGSVLFKDKVDMFLSENKQVSEWLKISTEETSTEKDYEGKVKDCYDIEAIMGVFEGVDTTNFMKTCDFFNGILECIRSEQDFKCINPDIDKEMILYEPEFAFYGKPQLTISIDIAYYPRLFYLYFNGTEVMSLYDETKKLMTSTNTTRDLTIFGFILYINYVIYCIELYIHTHNYIIEGMIYVYEHKQELEYETTCLSFRQEIKDDKNGLELLDSINAIKGSKNFFTGIKDRFIGFVTGSTGVSTDAKDLDFLIQYLKLDERYHYFLRTYIKNKSLFLFNKKDFDIFFEALILHSKSNKIYDKFLIDNIENEELRKKFKEEVKLFIEFYEDLPKNMYTNAFIRDIKLISSNSFILRFIKFQESWSKKKYIKTFFHIKPRTKIQRLWEGMSTENKELIKSMVKTSDMSISFTHRNEITTLKTVIDRLSSNRLISNFFETNNTYELFEFKDKQNSDYQVTVEFRDFKKVRKLGQRMNGLRPGELFEGITIEEFKKSINYIFTGFIKRLFNPDSEPRSLSSRPPKKQKVKEVEVEVEEEGPEVDPVPPCPSEPRSRSLSSLPDTRSNKKRKEVEMSFKSKKIKSPKKSNSKTKSKTNSKSKKSKKSKTKTKKSNSKSKKSKTKSKKSKTKTKSNSKSKTKSKKSKTKTNSKSKTKSKKSNSKTDSKSNKSKTKSKKSNSKTKTNSK